MYNIEIKGDKNFIIRTENALKFIKENSLYHYKLVIKYIGIIQQIKRNSGMWAEKTPPIFKVGDETSNSDTEWYAGSIVHDAYHSKLYNDYKRKYKDKEVPDNIWMGEKAEIKCQNIQYRFFLKSGASKDRLKYTKDIIKSKWWENNKVNW